MMSLVGCKTTVDICQGISYEMTLRGRFVVYDLYSYPLYATGYPEL